MSQLGLASSQLLLDILQKCTACSLFQLQDGNMQLAEAIKHMVSGMSNHVAEPCLPKPAQWYLPDQHKGALLTSSRYSMNVYDALHVESQDCMCTADIPV